MVVFLLCFGVLIAVACFDFFSCFYCDSVGCGFGWRCLCVSCCFLGCLISGCGFAWDVARVFGGFSLFCVLCG